MMPAGDFMPERSFQNLTNHSVEKEVPVGEPEYESGYELPEIWHDAVYGLRHAGEPHGQELREYAGAAYGTKL